MIWSSLFTVGNFLYGRYTPAVLLGITFAISAAVLIAVVRRIWAKPAFIEGEAIEAAVVGL